MAYDTIIDKAQLEGAITASANAIREKTGDTALIEWLADKGFADAIATIETGSNAGNSESEAQWIANITRKNENPVTKLPNVESIGTCAFYQSNNIMCTSLPESVTNIGQKAFYQCRTMPLTSLPSGLVHIQSSAFYYCEALTIKSIPESVKSVQSSAFSGCKLLDEITFKGQPNEIGTNVFYGCSNLKTINVPWAEGEVANAPWGATNATINYNYTGG